MLASAPGGALAAADVHVKWMNCSLHPGQLDIVYIENTGDTPQNLSGWELRSDGENERMSLTPAGSLAAGHEIFATAGAHAVNLPNEGVFLWSNDEMLRDSGDPPDYVRLLDSSGNQVSGMDCNHNPVAAPTAPPTAPPTEPPAVAATPSPAPAAQVRPASANPGAVPRPATSAVSQTAGTAEAAPNSVPVGGGPPGMDGDNAFAWVLAGALLATGGIAITGAAMRPAVFSTDGRKPRRCRK
jgi:hypothetical protein